jgi:molybdate/tungstate transport system ATP-binding protein
VDFHVVILGRNGSGKSTLLQTLAGFIKPVKGAITVDGVDVTDLPPSRRNMGYIPQEPVKLPLTPRQALEYFGRFYGRGYMPLLKELGVDHLVEKRDVSVGEGQLLALALVMLRDPAILLLDEPVSSLDYLNKLSFWKALKNLRKPALVVTHDPLEAAYIADVLYVIEDGMVSGPYPNTMREMSKEALQAFNLYEKLRAEENKGPYDYYHAE